jgi:hypothetical protein
MWKDSLHKVILRGRDGSCLSGFAYQEDFSEKIRLINRDGKEQAIPVTSLKAAFFVKDFKGDPEHQELHFLHKLPACSMLWARVEFLDGEVVEGKVPNSLELLLQPGFYLWPSDDQSNNLAVYVVKSSIKNFSILSPVE